MWRMAFSVGSLLAVTTIFAHTASPGGNLPTITARFAEDILPAGAGERQDALREARSFASVQGDDGSWQDIDFADPASDGDERRRSRHLDRTLSLAIGWQVSRARGRPEEELRRGAGRALAFWLDQDVRANRWWWLQIGHPRLVGRIALLLETELTDTRRAKIAEILSRGGWRTWIPEADRHVTMTGQNLVWMAENQVIRGCLLADEAQVREALQKVYEIVRVAHVGQEGIQADWSFHQHGPLLYSGGYGAGFAVDVARFLFFAHDTELAAPDDVQATLAAYLLDGLQWKMRGPALDFGILGREITRRGAGRASRILPAAELMARLPGPRQEGLLHLAERIRKPGIQPPPYPLTGNRHFWRSDFMAHHRAGWYASTRMYSTRIANTDSPHNQEGLRSHHLADALTQVMVHGREYEDIFGLWNWKKLPGVTSVQDEDFREDEIRQMGKSPFAGGVSDGRHGLAAMDLDRREISAKLARFYFEEEVLVVGADIRSDDKEHSVFTTLDQKRLRGPVSLSVSPSPLDEGTRVVSDVRWVHHDQVGYAFLEPREVYLQNGPQTGNWHDINRRFPDEPVTEEIFSLWLDHGRAVVDGSYAYLLVPAVERAGMEAWASRSRIALLSNTPAVQAAAHADLRMVQAVFRRPGEISAGGVLNLRIQANRACLLLLREEPGTLRLAVASPENEAADVEIRVNRRLAGDNAVAARENSSVARFALPGGLDAGRSVVQEFTILR